MTAMFPAARAMPGAQRPCGARAVSLEREDERRASLTMQKGYAGRFAFGVVLTTWGSLIG
jgi:hypothetical protein